MSRHESRQRLAREFGATDIVAERGDEGIAAIEELLGGVGAVSQEFGQLLALVRTESAQHPVHRVVMRVRSALGVADTHAYAGVFRCAE